MIGDAYFAGNATTSNITATGTLTVLSSATSTLSGGLVATCFATSTNGPCLGLGGGSVGGGSGTVTSVTNSDGTLTISGTPTIAPVVSLNLANSNTWTGQQTFSSSTPVFSTMTQGSIFFAGAGGLLSQNNSNFFWDNTKIALDIGTTSQITGNSNAGVFNVVGTTTNTTNLAFFRGNTNNSAQLALVNANSGASSSADFVVGNDLEDTSSKHSYYGDFGINSSGNTNANFTGLLPNDTYLYGSDGGLDLGAATSSTLSAIRFFTGGLLAANQKMVITSAGFVGIGTTSPSNMLEVNGNAFIAGNFTIGTTTGTTTIFSNLQVNYGSLAHDVTSGVTNIDSLQTGALNFDTDAGVVSWADLPLDSAPTAGTVESYSAQIGGTPILTVYGEANGASLVQNTRIGIGSTTPFATLALVGSGSDSPFIVASSSGTQFFNIDKNGNVGVGTTSPVSVFAVVGTTTISGNLMPGLDNVYSLGTSTARWSTLYSHLLNTGDVVFGNKFDLLEAMNPDGSFATGSNAAMVWENDTGTPMFKLDYLGNLTVDGDVCAYGTQCLSSSIANLNDLTSRVNALSSSTDVISSSNTLLGSQVTNLATATTSIASLAVQVSLLSAQLDSLSSSTQSWMSSTSTVAYVLATSTLQSVASTTAMNLASSTSFVAMITASVMNSISSVSNWVINKLSANVGVFNSEVDTPLLRTQTAAVTNGIEMTDSATGSIYCVRITNGQFSQSLGSCIASTTPSISNPAPVAPIIVTPVVPPTITTPIVTSSATSSSTIVVSTTSIVSTVPATTTPIVIPIIATTSIATTSTATTPAPLVPDTQQTTAVPPTPAATPAPTIAPATVVPTPAPAPVPTPAPAAVSGSGVSPDASAGSGSGQ